MHLEKKGVRAKRKVQDSELATDHRARAAPRELRPDGEDDPARGPLVCAHGDDGAVLPTRSPATMSWRDGRRGQSWVTELGGRATASELLFVNTLLKKVGDTCHPGFNGVRKEKKKVRHAGGAAAPACA